MRSSHPVATCPRIWQRFRAIIGRWLTRARSLNWRHRGCFDNAISNSSFCVERRAVGRSGSLVGVENLQNFGQQSLRITLLHITQQGCDKLRPQYDSRARTDDHKSALVSCRTRRWDGMTMNKRWTGTIPASRQVVGASKNSFLGAQ